MAMRLICGLIWEQDGARAPKPMRQLTIDARSILQIPALTFSARIDISRANIFILFGFLLWNLRP
ncbi:MAG: hypothetical protein B7Y44_09430 [Sphingomonadales bacterium 28-55-16]|nr:MAG: hypothetical protein B7Y44_09430 [Sphingomonadales bacterium 28-55-16]